MTSLKMGDKSNSVDVQLTEKEKNYLEAVETGDAAGVKTLLREKGLNINVKDNTGKTALEIAIVKRELDIIKLLVQHGVEVGNALLRAADMSFVKAVEVLCDYIKTSDAQGKDIINACTDNVEFPPGVTPLVLAAHHNNYDICKMLLENGGYIEEPQNDEALAETRGLTRSLLELQIYRALTSESYICLTSKDPINRAFELSHTLNKLSRDDVQFGTEFDKLEDECEAFAAELLSQARNEQEITTVLTHGPEVWSESDVIDTIKPHKAFRAVKYQQKQFVSNPNCQELIYDRFYFGIKGWDEMSKFKKFLFTIAIMFGYPFLSILYIIYPFKKLNQLVHVPYVKFLMHTASSLAFLLLIIMVLLRIELWPMIGFAAFEPMTDVSTSEALDFLSLLDKDHGRDATIPEILMLVFIIAMTWREIKEWISEGIITHFKDYWNILDFIQLSLYWVSYIFFFYGFAKQKISPVNIPQNETEWFNSTVANITLYEIKEEVIARVADVMLNAEGVKNFSTIIFHSLSAFYSMGYPVESTRSEWPGDDPNIIAEALFALANIVSFLRLVHIMVINRHIGPLQISFSGMFYDIVKFLVIFFLMLLAFAVGLTQLYKFYDSDSSWACIDEKEFFDSKFECREAFDGIVNTMRTLFWSLFGLIDLDVLNVDADHSFTVSVGEFAFALYHGLAIIILLNALIAMMSNTYTRVEENADIEWKFYRTEMWMSFFEEGSTLPPPFNVIPSFKTMKRILCCERCRGKKKKKNNDAEIAILQTNYEDVVHQLTLRYISDKRAEGYDEEEAGGAVTQNDLMLLKQDISSFRYDVSDSINQLTESVTKILKKLEDKK
ncbi:short transient receptor potential channel 5-like [Glandiceps talaboti]